MAEEMTNGAPAQTADIEMADQQQTESNGYAIPSGVQIAPVAQITSEAPIQQIAPVAQIVSEAPVQQIAPVAQITSEAPTEQATAPRPPAHAAPLEPQAPAPIAAPIQAPAPASIPTPPARTSSQPPAFLPPEKPVAHGSPTRVYINQNVTPHLLEGMKYLAAYEPEKPLKWLSEFLAKRSAEVEGS